MTTTDRSADRQDSGVTPHHSAVRVDPLDDAAIEARVLRPESGAVVTFRGIVRDHDHGRQVRELEYVGHPGAEAALADVVAAFADEPLLLGVAAEHRIGTLNVGDVALVAVVSAAHRAAAFEGCGRLVDEIKRRLPVWKRQVFLDGSDEWVNCP